MPSIFFFFGFCWGWGGGCMVSLVIEKYLYLVKRINKLLPNNPTSNITEVNEQIYARAKLVRNKISVPKRIRIKI